MKFRQSVISILTCAVILQSIIPASSYANTTIATQETQKFAIEAGASRLIYDPNSNGVTLSVSNPQDYPILVEASTLTEDKINKANFLVTPPLFKLAGKQRSKIKVVKLGGNVHSDRETLNWLCLNAIPPERDSAWIGDYQEKVTRKASSKILVQMRMTSCIKLLVRPSSLNGTPIEYANKLSWYKEGAHLIVKNPSPFYMNLKDIKFGTKVIDNPGYIPPMGTLKLDYPSNYSGIVKWKLITDLGGDSEEFKSEIK